MSVITLMWSKILTIVRSAKKKERMEIQALYKIARRVVTIEMLGIRPRDIVDPAEMRAPTRDLCAWGTGVVGRFQG